MCSQQGRVEMGDHLYRPATVLLQLKILMFLATRAHCWLMDNPLSIRGLWSFSAGLLSSWSEPSLYWWMKLLLLRCRTLHLSLLNFKMFFSAPLKGIKEYTKEVIQTTCAPQHPRWQGNVSH